MKKERMLYRNYKKHYADCDTVSGTYDKISKTIEVIIPDGRMKKSGVRGRHFRGYELYLINESGEIKYTTYRAVSEENAMKQHIRTCKQNGWTPCDPPKGKIAHVFL